MVTTELLLVGAIDDDIVVAAVHKEGGGTKLVAVLGEDAFTIVAVLDRRRRPCASWLCRNTSALNAIPEATCLLIEVCRERLSLLRNFALLFWNHICNN